MMTERGRDRGERQVENPVSRRVVEKAGFAFVGTGPQGAPARGGLVACDRFRLTREAWLAAEGFGRRAGGVEQPGKRA